MFDTVNHGILLENLHEAGVICHPSIKSPVEFPRGQSLKPSSFLCNVCDLLMQPNNSDVTLLTMQPYTPYMLHL